MADLAGLVLPAIALGLVGSASMDAWSALLRRFGIPTLDYRLLGRWVGHMPSGRFVHDRLAAAEPIPGECAIGYAAHYAIGIAFAGLLLVLVGQDWLNSPTVGPAIAIGLATIAAPWFVMQPAMGAGVAGSKTADPAATRLRNIGTHLVYGIGLYLGAVVVSVAAWR